MSRGIQYLEFMKMHEDIEEGIRGEEGDRRK
jgi:hypothetical protein